MKNICIIGAGQLGSRHLQALKGVKQTLNIRVIDTSGKSLSTAKERYDSIKNDDCKHEIAYLTKISELDVKEIEIAIIASNSDTRKAIIEELLSKANVKYFILEKLLFNRKEDYYFIRDLFRSRNVKAYANCSMRTMWFYRQLKDKIKNKRILYTVTGSQYGLVTNLIHYLDHIAFLTDCNEFTADTSGLEKDTIESKRKGFLEVNGTYTARFSNGATGIFECYAEGNAPVVIQIFNEDIHCISRESEGKVWMSRADNEWKWEELDFAIPFQSQTTTLLVEDILSNGTCPLVEYEDTTVLHLTLLESLLNHINRESKEKFDYYPFT